MDVLGSVFLAGAAGAAAGFLGSVFLAGAAGAAAGFLGSVFLALVSFFFLSTRGSVFLAGAAGALTDFFPPRGSVFWAVSPAIAFVTPRVETYVETYATKVERKMWKARVKT